MSVGKMRTKKLADGTFLVWMEGDNEHLNHWHVAPDGTLLSVKEGGDHKYKRSDVRRNIETVLSDSGLCLEHGWRALADKSR